MSKHLARDLDDLRGRVLDMAARVDAAIAGAVRAVRDRDPSAARAVVDGDEAVDALENRIYEECLKVLALHQPVAGDLRRVIATMTVNTDLERMGDLAVDIAERADALAGGPDVVPVPDGLVRMTELAAGMVRDAVRAFADLDGGLARAVVGRDDAVDRLHAAVIAGLIGGMKRSPAAVEPGLSLFSVTRAVERIADHATNVAEDVVYLADGETIGRLKARHET